MNAEPPPPIRSWRTKFRDALRGVRAGVRGQSSFAVHLLFAAGVVAAAAALRLDRGQWYVLLLCITIVLAAELFNSALESMARAITGQWNPHLGNALDIASGAVLVASLGAAVVGAAIFIHRAGSLLRWW